MKAKLVFATHNQGKIKELKHLFVGFEDRLELLCLGDVSVPDVIEDGNSFFENASKKAIQTSIATGLPALADDSGLVVDALGGAPGIYSARYAGTPSSDANNNLKLLQDMNDIPQKDRQAHYFASLVFADTQSDLKNEVYEASGQCHGQIMSEPRGDGGFGYDPLFLLPKYGKTLAEMPPAAKTDLTHRAKALKNMIPKILGHFKLVN